MRRLLTILAVSSWAIGCAPSGVMPVTLPPDPPGDDDTGPADDDDDDDDLDPGVTPIEDVPGSDEDPSDRVFTWGEVPTFDIGLESAAIASLEVDPYTYVEGTFEYDGFTFEPVGVRLKGQGSFQSIHEKPAFKVKFNEYVPGGRFLGMESVTLNNMVWDYSMMHERIAYAVYREMGVPASRCNHATVSLNGTHYGLYSLVESPDQAMIARWFDDDQGSLFEGWDVDFTPEYVASFQLDWGPDDRTNLQGVADTLLETGPAAIETVQEYLHLDEFIDYWAVGAVVTQYDAYPYTWPGDDFHVYDDPTSTQLWFIPWGVDETFYYPDNDPEAVNGVIAQRCQAVPECAQAWLQQVWVALDVAEGMDWATLCDEIRGEIWPLVEADTRKPYDDGTVWSYQVNMCDVIEGRRQSLEGHLGAP